MTTAIKSEPTPVENRVQANGHLTPAEAKAILQQEAQTRVEACQAEIQKVLDKYQCAIDVAVLLRAGQVIPQVQIISK